MHIRINYKVNLKMDVRSYLDFSHYLVFITLGQSFNGSFAKGVAEVYKS
jgi:hypothetical protein